MYIYAFVEFVVTNALVYCRNDCIVFLFVTKHLSYIFEKIAKMYREKHRRICSIFLTIHRNLNGERVLNGRVLSRL